MISIYSGQKAQDLLTGLTQPSALSDHSVESAVRQVVTHVRDGGDGALRELAQRFGDPVPEDFLISASEIEAAVSRVPIETRQVLEQAAENIRFFAQSVKDGISSVYLDRGDFLTGLDFRPVECVACYVPGGRYPLPSTALMTAITAQVAGVHDVCIVSPSLRDEIVYAGTLAGVKRFYRLGGAQAVAAMALGTESIPRVDMVVGPGNAYVTEAKRQLQGMIGIDMLAGPSEVGIIADDGANPHWVALDLLAQAEHDPEARAYLFTNSADLAAQVVVQIEAALKELNLPDFMRRSLEASGIFVLPSLDACVEACNQIAPEHLELQVADPMALKLKLRHYGALFMGYETTVPHGDYMAGPNHTLPTGRTARFCGSLTPLTFLRPQSWLEVKPEGKDLSQATGKFAELEGLTAHAQAARLRCPL